MTDKPRLQGQVLRERLGHRLRVVFVDGPRRVGKTTACSALASSYLDWDRPEHRRIILRGPAAVAEYARLGLTRDRPAILLLDNLHHYRKWTEFLRRFCNRYGSRLRVIVGGNSVFHRIGAGRRSLSRGHSILRMHPWSVGECARIAPPTSPVQPPTPIADADWTALLEHGGFPEPFLRRDSRFTRRWRATHHAQLMRDELGEIAHLQDQDTTQMLAILLASARRRP
jgi:predicted AAA+ superfamily ATPase